MPRTPKGKGGRAGRVTLAVLVTLATLMVLFFIVARSQGELSVPENALGSLITPVQNAVRSAVDWAGGWVKDLRDIGELRANYDAALKQVSLLELQLQQYEDDANENARLLAQLDAKQTYESMDPLFARVIARDPGVWFDVFTVDRGTLDGVTADMAVITGDGLVGRVLEAGLNYAKVLTVIDSRSAVSGLIERTRYNGVLRGQLSSDAASADLYMYYLPSVSDVVPGDVVLTSGEDGVYPKGLPIGTVRSISRRTDTSDQFVAVTPLVDFQRLEEVLILRVVVNTGEEERLPVVPTPTPRPISTESATPNPNASPTPSPSSTAYARPTPTPQFTTAPTTTPGSPGGLPEDEWAEG